MREVVVASSARTPVGRAYKGTLRATRPDELAALAIKSRDPRLRMPEAEQGMNLSRIVSLGAGLPTCCLAPPNPG